MDDMRNPRLVGGHPALDLVNSVAPRGAPAEQDWLGTPADLLAWAQRAGVLDATEAAAVQHAWSAHPASDGAALRAVIEVREATYTVLAAALTGTPRGPADVGPALDRLAAHWAAAADRTRLVPRSPVDGGSAGGAVRLAVGSVPGMLLADRLTHEAVDLLRAIDLTALRRCPVEDGGCGWLFLDHSRNGSRRWCSMADCGAQAKSRRLTARRREHRAII